MVNKRLILFILISVFAIETQAVPTFPALNKDGSIVTGAGLNRLIASRPHLVANNIIYESEDDQPVL